MLWRGRRPDLVHIATEGPLGWSALAAAAKLKLPVATDFHTNFHSYSEHYGIGWLKKPITTYLRKFHNKAQRTFVPTTTLQDELAAIGVVIGAPLGGLLGALVGSLAAGIFQISSFEGGAGYYVMFFFVLPGILIGAIVGAVVTARDVTETRRMRSEVE